MTTLCENCEYSHALNEKRKPYRWMCIKFPRLDESNYVTTSERMTDPFMYCADINGGACPQYKKTKGNQMELET